MSDDRFVRKDPNPVPLDQLKQPDWDVRDYRTDEDIDNIADTLEQKGQVMPILLGAVENGLWPVLDGNHRVLAAKRLGWHDIDAIKTKSGADNNEIQIVANISRMELTPSEKLSTFDFMLNNLEWSQARAAKEVGYDRSQVTRYASVLRGYGEIKEFFMQGELGVTACYQLNQVPDRDRAVNIARTAVKEGYKDRDVVYQAKYARNDEEGKDVMYGAGSEETTQNMNQVRRNAEQIQSLDPIDQQGIDEAQVAPQSGSTGQQGGSPSDTTEEPQGPPCMACETPMNPGPLSQVTFHPELAQELGVEEVRFCEQCTGKLIGWWMERQDFAGTEGESVEDAEE